jgi:predicted ABC-type transport system involved in lysophospholipase L1 biosynthesis ATPase subunit
MCERILTMGSSTGADIMLANVFRTYSSANTTPTPVLRGVDLQVPAGESIAISGASGSGKTTLLQIMGTLDMADSGEVRVNGRELGALDEASRATFRNREIGFVFQSHHLLPQLTAFENILVPTWAADGSHALEHQARARHLLDRIGLADRSRHFPGQLSGGEQQRIALARALIMKPCLILADEPTGALDYDTAQHLIELLLELNRDEGATLVLVTHSRACAQRMSRQVELRNGIIQK